jgi:hypothetical protein
VAAQGKGLITVTGRVRMATSGDRSFSIAWASGGAMMTVRRRVAWAFPAMLLVLAGTLTTAGGTASS